MGVLDTRFLEITFKSGRLGHNFPLTRYPVDAVPCEGSEGYSPPKPFTQAVPAFPTIPLVTETPWKWYYFMLLGECPINSCKLPLLC